MHLPFAHRLLLFLLSFTFGAYSSIENAEIHLSRPLPGVQENQQFIPQLKPPKNDDFSDFLDALGVLQDDYFATWQGIWPTSIDWTSAVLGTYLSAALTTISRSAGDNANLINKYFSELVASYFGQDAFALRQEAYDDMLWVVLGWLESIKFINVHSELHYSNSTSPWYGTIWTSVFAHRARLFWDLASQGWDTSLCNGGMVWSPYLEPYKNAITNELYITASISMYLYFPGDDNPSPFSSQSLPRMNTAMIPPAPPRDPKYLAAAVEGYKWLKGSNMTDSGGLYVDGFHISGWRKNNTQDNKRCDSRNEMVYTYNQGVLLSGQRGLYEATGAKSYLEDGHELVADVIAATGWNLKTDSLLMDHEDNSILGKWHGLGRSGIVEEACDAPGYCSQDGQTFKGILFHHLTLFCDPLPDHLVLPDDDVAAQSLEEVRKYHSKQCAKYSNWIKHNARAALTTRNKAGKFGMWWGAPVDTAAGRNIPAQIPDQAVDYRNLGTPESWNGKPFGGGNETMEANSSGGVEKRGNGNMKGRSEMGIMDLNDRGRGRTVETQGGGLALLRAQWELVDEVGA
ncbi:Six-hairpin glycosidase [Glarea lozoyensis ATCC 20868]|uniref:Six-hairpin glycosidase n=1 Tax=Glarea lozoyensis (strain ATCC 20868 / MF5171) TaxID=1116229 RepID=S3DDC9_GLAL2|nr:Six-hairpin glycosidase [Glarea lozoyensis ATCC 20868]EPE24673.1 Six-hairpin glycosidase [Glarea lozoyensis ATCC 20868]